MKSRKAKGSKKRATVKSKSAKKKDARTLPKRRSTRASQIVEKTLFPARRGNAVSGMESGDLQGLSNAERADSESVDELIEDGNAYEAGVVEGVEEAENADEGGVRTREVPEDDVPPEYLDKD